MASRHPHAPPSPSGLATSWGVVFALLMSGVVACGMTVRGVPGSPDGGACELRADGVCAATQPEGVCGARRRNLRRGAALPRDRAARRRRVPRDAGLDACELGRDVRDRARVRPGPTRDPRAQQLARTGPRGAVPAVRPGSHVAGRVRHALRPLTAIPR